MDLNLQQKCEEASVVNFNPNRKAQVWSSGNKNYYSTLQCNHASYP
jgi:hypothetical protein